MGLQLLGILGISLGMTILLEGLFAVTLCVRSKKDLLLVCMVNLLTNPPVVLGYYLAVYYTSWNPTLVKIPLELLAISVEAYYYKTRGQRFLHPVWFALIANLFSFSVGMIISMAL